MMKVVQKKVDNQVLEDLKELNKYGKDSGVQRKRSVRSSHDKKKGGSGAPKYGKAYSIYHTMILLKNQ